MLFSLCFTAFLSWPYTHNGHEITRKKRMILDARFFIILLVFREYECKIKLVRWYPVVKSLKNFNKKIRLLIQIIITLYLKVLLKWKWIRNRLNSLLRSGIWWNALRVLSHWVACQAWQPAFLPFLDQPLPFSSLVLISVFSIWRAILMACPM